MKWLAFVLVLGLLAGPTGAATLGGPLPPLFPRNNWWNLDISAAPLDPSSGAYISFIGPTRQVHPDFGGEVSPGSVGIYGFSYIVVKGSQGKLAVEFTYWDESDGVDLGTGLSFPFYPIPPEAITQPHWIEGGDPGNVAVGGDRHILIVDEDNRHLYELFAVYHDGTKWTGGSGAFFDLKTNGRRPETWTSADAAGLAILPGLVRYDEVYGTAEIGHAFRVTVQASNGHVWPASHTAGSAAGALPMGARLRLKVSKDISGYSPEMQRVFRAMKKYGLIVADNGSNMYVSGTFDTRWNNDILNPAFHSLKASDFEVVKLGLRGPTVLDFDGDTGADHAVYHPASGLWYARQSGSGTTFSVAYGGPSHTQVAGDYDGDGRTDVAVYHEPTGVWSVRQSATGTTVNLAFGGSGFVPVPKDYDGDGLVDFAAYHPTSGLWYTRSSSTGSVTSQGYGGPGYTPVPGDYDGDNRADIAVYHDATGLWFVRYSTTGATVTTGYGGPGFQPVPADYDGDARTDLAVYHAASGLWYVRQSATGTTFNVGYGGPEYTPVPRDQDADGKADLAVYHEATGLWFVRLSTTLTTATLGYGGSGFEPVRP